MLILKPKYRPIESLRELEQKIQVEIKRPIKLRFILADKEINTMPKFLMPYYEAI